MSDIPACIFCQIVAGSAPCHRVYEDEKIIVFMDIRPVAHGHTLVVTREHFENLLDTSDEAIAAIARVSRRVARALWSALEPDGIFVAQANGAAAGQTVFHYHMHLIPRASGADLRVHGRTQADAQDLAALARSIAAALEHEA